MDAAVLAEGVAPERQRGALHEHRRRVARTRAWRDGGSGRHDRHERHDQIQQDAVCHGGRHARQYRRSRSAHREAGARAYAAHGGFVVLPRPCVRFLRESERRVRGDVPRSRRAYARREAAERRPHVHRQLHHDERNAARFLSQRSRRVSGVHRRRLACGRCRSGNLEQAVVLLACESIPRPDAGGRCHLG